MNNLLSTIVLALCAMAVSPSAIAAPSPVPLALEGETAQIGKRTTASFAETCGHFILFANTLTATCRLPGSSGSRGKKPSTPPPNSGPFTSLILLDSGTGFSSSCTELTLDLEDKVLLKAHCPSISGFNIFSQLDLEYLGFSNECLSTLSKPRGRNYIEAVTKRL
ncbi:hypothetical protein B0H13DRAFT_1899418 [Mycena leptocephala]|nr:hypothetical protein B0H13DRAFT_1899418 [Mycena leptocephala]